MVLRKLNLLNYKNLECISIAPHPQMNFIIGSNGAGKTNLLDSIYYTGMTRSYFSASDKNVCKFSQEFFRIEAFFSEQREDHELIVKVAPGAVKEFEWDGVPLKKATDHIGKVPVVLVSPDDIFSFIQDANSRRSFLDQTLVQTDHKYLTELLQYNRLLKQKTQLLKSPQLKGLETILDSFDQQMIQPAMYIAQKRAEMVAELNPLLIELSAIFSLNEQNSSLIYQSDSDDKILEKWHFDRPKDLRTARVHSGIHKDRLIAEFNGKSLKDFGSQGQIKTFILSLRLAQYNFLYEKCGMKPILLLDELFAKLDGARVRSLMQFLSSKHSGQCFITDNYLSRALDLKNQLVMESTIFELDKNGIRIYEKKQ
ncbi:MAG: DNA replication/repair protein RecF [Saprospiraceae bacterium]|nr:DNA replication/repair protein RecF [Saprospiraceae bacterium]